MLPFSFASDFGSSDLHTQTLPGALCSITDIRSDNLQSPCEFGLGVLLPSITLATMSTVDSSTLPNGIRLRNFQLSDSEEVRRLFLLTMIHHRKWCVPRDEVISLNVD